MSASSLGASSYTNAEIQAMLTATPEEKQAKIDTLYEALQLYQIGNFSASDDNIRISDNGIDWEFHKPGYDAVRTNTGCCATDSNWLRYILDGDYEEVGYMATSQRDGSGHIYNYIKMDGWYYFIDLTHYRTDWVATAVETGELQDYWNSDRVLGNIHKVRDVQDYVNYVQSAFTDPPGLMFFYTAENCLTLDGVLSNRGVTITCETVSGVDVKVVFDGPNDALYYQFIASPRVKADFSTAESFDFAALNAFRACLCGQCLPNVRKIGILTKQSSMMGGNAMKHRRLLCLLLAVLLLAALAPVRTTAAPTVYFTSVNDRLLPELSDSTMPFWSDGQLYVPYTVVSGTDLGVFYARSRDKTTSIVYRQGIALTFDFAAKTAIDQDGNSYPYHAIVRGDVVFLPVALLAEFFSLDYSYTRVTYGYLVRVKSDTVVLSDARFIEAASTSMEQRYNEYLKTYRDNTGTDAPAPELTDDSIERAYLLVRVTEESASGALLGVLAGTDDAVTFIFTEETVSAYGALARRVTVSGSAIALAVDASGGSRQTIGAIERANRALWSACNEKARLVLLENATEETTHAVLEAGYCPITLELDYSGDTLPALYQLTGSISTLARKNGCAAYLGTDSAVQESWSGLLSRLRSAGCPISRLSELSAQRES